MLTCQNIASVYHRAVDLLSTSIGSLLKLPEKPILEIAEQVVFINYLHSFTKTCYLIYEVANSKMRMSMLRRFVRLSRTRGTTLNMILATTNKVGHVARVWDHRKIMLFVLNENKVGHVTNARSR